jgi:hypothetical protein
MRERFGGWVARGLVCVFSLAASAVDAGQAPAAPANGLGLQKGSIELTFMLGTALPTTWLRARSNRHLTIAALDLGRVMTGRIGNGRFSGDLELLVEIAPLLVLRQPERVLGVAASPVFLRWNFVGSGRLRPFAELSGGLLITSQDVPAKTTRLNFIDQAGFGVRLGIGPKRAVVIGYRFQHISNGGRVRPNPGANFNLLYGGLSLGR